MQTSKKNSWNDQQISGPEERVTGNMEFEGKNGICGSWGTRSSISRDLEPPGENPRRSKSAVIAKSNPAWKCPHYEKST